MILRLLKRHGLVPLLITLIYFHVNDGKLEPRVKKAIFLSYATGVKGYRLWCLDPKSPKFVISRDITFDENYMLQPRKESVVDIIGSGEDASKQVELESKITKRVQESTCVEPINDAQNSTSGDDTLQEQQYRQIRPSKCGRIY